MPLPVMGAAAAAAWLARFAAAKKGWMIFGAGVGAGVAGLDLEKIKGEVYELVVTAAARFAGLSLDPNDPLSDASFAAAISEKLGVPIRSLKNEAMLREDMASYAALLLNQKTGVELTNPTDPTAIKLDLMRFGGALISERTGIPLTDVTDPERVKEDVRDWAVTAMYAQMAKDATFASDELQKAGVDIGAIVAQVNAENISRDGARPVEKKAMVMAVLQSSITQHIVRMGTKILKDKIKTKRQLQMARASERFRERHGNRMQYVPIDRETRKKP